VTRVDAGRALALLALLIAPLLPAGLSPWSLPAGFGDLVAYHYPMRHLTGSALQSGRLPFWNPHLFAGLPLAANPQSVLYYPPSLLGALFPLTLALSWDNWLHLAWAALGAALLARRGGARGGLAWGLGAVYALSPFLVYRVAEGIPTLLASLAWAPWCWLFWAYGPPGWLGACWALQLMSGHPQFCAINALGLAVWTAWARPRRLAAFAREGAIAAALSPLVWAPLGEFLGQSVRRDWPAAFSLGYSVGLAEFATWIFPGALGDPISKTWAAPPSVFFETTGVTMGLGALALAVWGIRRAGAGPWLLLGAGLFLAAGSNNPVYPWLLENTPMSFLRTPSRALFLALWAVWLSAAAACARLPATGAKRRWALAALVAAVVELAAWDSRFLEAADAYPYLVVNQTLAQQMGEAPFRVLGDPGLANQNKVMLYRAMNVNGYEAFYLAGYPAFCARSEGKPAADASRTYLSNGGTPEMRRLCVGYRLSLEGKLEKAGAGHSLPLAYFVDANDEPLAEQPRLRITRERAERWLVEGAAWPSRAAALVLSQSAYPGWRVWIGGREAELSRSGAILQAVARGGEDGPVSVAASFAPSRWGALVAAAVAAWALWLGAAVRRTA
jgi:hypothetical protein